MSEDNPLDLTTEEIEQYRELLPCLLPVAQCFVSASAFTAVKYAMSEPNHLILRIIRTSAYPATDERIKFFARLPLSTRTRAIKKTYYQNPRAYTLFRNGIRTAAEVGLRGWRLCDLELKLIGILEDSYDELVDQADKLYAANMQFALSAEVGRDLVHYLYEVVAGQAQIDQLEKTKSQRLKEILGLDSNDVTIVAQRIMDLVENPKGAERWQAANIIAYSYLNDLYAVNRGKSEKAKIKALGEGVFYEALQYTDQDTKEIGVEVRDPQGEDAFDEVNEYMMFEQAIQMLNDQADKDAFELVYRLRKGHLSVDEYEVEAEKKGLTRKKIQNRLRYMPTKYPGLTSILSSLN